MDPRQKKIIFILPDLETGGAERIVTTIANHLPRDRYLPKILLLRKQGGYLEILKEDVGIIDLKIQRIRNSIFPILNALRREKPDLVFCGFGEVNAYLSLFLKLFPSTKFIARETNVVSKHVSRPEIRFFYRFYNSFDKIVCQSDDMRTDLLKNFKVGQNKLVKINNPVDFEFIAEQLIAAVRPAQFSDDYKNVVAIGNLSVRKGFTDLLKIFVLLRSEKIMLHIIGDGQDREKLDKIKTEFNLENVIFHGRQKNPYQFLKFADLFILSSRYEGFPNVLLEAGACGVYSLANDCPGGIREIIKAGINGEIADINNDENFALTILQLLSKTFDREKIVESIRSRFSKEIILQQYFHLIHEVLSN